MKPLAIDLFCGLGGWADGLLAEGFDVIGFDIECHQYGAHRYPAQLVLQDVRTLHGAQFRDATLIVASPPCQAYSYRAMPWSRAKALPPPDNELFETCFRIQREACEATGRHIPLIVENVRGAQKWVGVARWNFGSYYLWGDVPALMPHISPRSILKPQQYQRRHGTGSWFAIDMASARAGVTDPSGVKVGGISFSGYGTPGYRGVAFNGTAQARIREEIKNGNDWFGPGADCSLQRRHGSKSTGRKAASAMIAKIPLPLARHIAAVYRTQEAA